MCDKYKQNSSQIKSYVQRLGRITKQQQRSIDYFGLKYIINYNENYKLDFSKIFKNDNEVILEIGFGMGESLIEMALYNKTKNYIGIEVYKPGVGNILHKIEQQNVTNLLIMNHDAVEILKNMIEDKSLLGIQIYFPDPWYKKKHNKRRIINQKNINLFAEKLKSDGLFHYASDWFPYSEKVLDLLENNDKYKNFYSKFAPRPEWRPLTKFEKRGKKLEHSILDIIFKKI